MGGIVMNKQEIKNEIKNLKDRISDLEKQPFLRPLDPFMQI